MTPQDAINRLIAGNARWATRTSARRTWAPPGRSPEAGQWPFAAILSCADSRVVPEDLFDVAGKNLFILRNAGNIVDPTMLGSVEYAIEHTGISLVVALGHTNCGAVNATAASIRTGTMPGAVTLALQLVGHALVLRDDCSATGTVRPVTTELLPQPTAASARGCYRPVRLRQVDRADLTARMDGVATYARCGTRHEAKCAACAELYRRDAVTLIERGVPEVRARGEHLLFVTLTAPGAAFFGTAHHRRKGKRTGVCPCGTAHSKSDPLLGAPINPAAFRYDRAARWNSVLPELWRRFLIALARELPTQSIAYIKTVELQRRGLVHVHAIVRINPDGVRLPRQEVQDAVRRAALHPSVDGMTFGPQMDVRFAMQRPPKKRRGESVADDKARVFRAPTRNTFARYLAKYATKGAEQATKKGTVGPELLEHHEKLRRAADPICRAWLDARRAERAEIPTPRGEEESLEEFVARRESDARADQVLATRARHRRDAFGYGGQFLTKSRDYSTTFRALRDEAREAAMAAAPRVDAAELVWVVEGFGLLPEHEADTLRFWEENLKPRGYDPPVFTEASRV